MLLKYKTVMMTGGASGIGRATVLMLAKEGARVILCDVNEAGANETIRSAEDGLVEFLKVELTDGASVDACARTAIERSGGKIDAFVNAAGRFLADTVLAKHDENYMPPEVAKALKEQGVWKDPGKPAKDRVPK